MAMNQDLESFKANLLQSASEHKQEALRVAEFDKKMQLDPAAAWKEKVVGTDIADIDADTLDQLDKKADTRLTGSKPGISPDAYESDPYRYQNNPGVEWRHKEMYALQNRIHPSQVTRDMLIEEGQRQKTEGKQEFFGDAPRNILDTGKKDIYGRDLIRGQNAQGQEYGDHMAAFENNADYGSPHNTTQQAEDIASGKLPVAKLYNRNRTPGEVVGDTAKRALIGAGKMVGEALTEIPLLAESAIMAPINAVSDTKREGVLSKINRHFGITEGLAKKVEDAKATNLSGPEQVTERKFNEGLEKYNKKGQERIDGYIAEGYSETAATALNTIDEIKHTLGKVWDDPSRILSLSADSIASLGNAAVMGKAGIMLAKRKMIKKFDVGWENNPEAVAYAKKQGVAFAVASGVATEATAAGAEMRNKVLEMTPEELAESQPYKDLLAQGKSHEEALGILSQDASLKVASIVAGVTMVTANITRVGKVESELFGGVTGEDLTAKTLGDVATKFTKGAAQGSREIPQEFAESSAEVAASNYTDQSTLGINQDESILEGAGTAGVLGGVAGGATGIGAAGTSTAVKMGAQALQGREQSGILKNYKLGSIAAKYESNGDYGTVSTGQGDHGGVSYGKHQLSSKQGTVQDFIKKSGFKKEFAGLEAGSTEFNNKWKELSKNEKFKAAQDKYTQNKYYKPILKKTGLKAKGPAVHEMLFSTAIQFGSSGGASLINKALANKDTASMSDEDIINAVQDYKAANLNSLFKSSSAAVKAGVAKRIENERADLLSVAKIEGAGASITTATPEDIRQASADLSNPSAPKSVKKADDIVNSGEDDVKLRDASAIKQELANLGATLVTSQPGSPEHTAAIQKSQEYVARLKDIEGQALGTNAKAILPKFSSPDYVPTEADISTVRQAAEAGTVTPEEIKNLKLKDTKLENLWLSAARLGAVSEKVYSEKLYAGSSDAVGSTGPSMVQHKDLMTSIMDNEDSPEDSYKEMDKRLNVVRNFVKQQETKLNNLKLKNLKSPSAGLQSQIKQQEAEFPVMQEYYAEMANMRNAYAPDNVKPLNTHYNQHSPEGKIQQAEIDSAFAGTSQAGTPTSTSSTSESVTEGQEKTGKTSSGKTAESVSPGKKESAPKEKKEAETSKEESEIVGSSSKEFEGLNDEELEKEKNDIDQELVAIEEQNENAQSREEQVELAKQYEELSRQYDDIETEQDRRASTEDTTPTNEKVTPTSENLFTTPLENLSLENLRAFEDFILDLPEAQTAEAGSKLSLRYDEIVKAIEAHPDYVAPTVNKAYEAFKERAAASTAKLVVDPLKALRSISEEEQQRINALEDANKLSELNNIKFTGKEPTTPEVDKNFAELLSRYRSSIKALKEAPNVKNYPGESDYFRTLKTSYINQEAKLRDLASQYSGLQENWEKAEKERIKQKRLRESSGSTASQDINTKFKVQVDDIVDAAKEANTVEAYNASIKNLTALANRTKNRVKTARKDLKGIIEQEADYAFAAVKNLQNALSKLKETTSEDSNTSEVKPTDVDTLTGDIPNSYFGANAKTYLQSVSDRIALLDFLKVHCK